ncbi:MAG TPA: hypothetical protein VF665_12410 [Longimicrobium sp.]|jgi:hypothetical protein|uniref:hypothetical protein n=1 Tax=Longimicrobium sp. TaxID=2029185 RepID=UPI002ED77DF2
MKSTFRSLSAAAVAALAVSACGIIGPDHDWELIPAVLLQTEQGPAVATPATAKAKAAFAVEIMTIGGGCEREGITEVVVNQQTRTAEITPLDYTDAAADVCTEELKTFRHTAQIAFDTPGPATIRVYHHLDTPTFARPEVTRTVQITE